MGGMGVVWLRLCPGPMQLPGEPRFSRSEEGAPQGRGSPRVAHAAVHAGNSRVWDLVDALWAVQVGKLRHERDRTGLRAQLAWGVRPPLSGDQGNGEE